MSAAPDKVNILLVDDQPARLLSYETILAELGENLLTARSGEEALGKLMHTEVALVLLDVSMPGMDGFETAAMIHDHPRFERTPIVFVTGVHDTEFDRLKGYKLGAIDYVSIPVVPEILRSKVSVLIELYRQRRELEKLNAYLAEANAQLALANTALQAEKTRELEALNRDLQAANHELQVSNRTLQAEITERKRAEAALLEADRQKDEFLAILAHELRNPLAPIRNSVEIMTRIAIEDERLRWSREVIDRQLVHLTRLVDDLLDVSRITRGAVRLTHAPQSVQAIVERAVEAAQPLIAEHGHELILDCPHADLFVHGDLTRLVQVVGNLLNNAAKYTDAGGRIQVAVQRCGDEVRISVRDNGIGIPEESTTKLFHLFSRLGGAQDRAVGGLGIGLALVRNLVEMHQGKVAVRSEGEGKGSEFTVSLPLLHAHEARVDDSPGAAPAPLAAQRRRILIADDNVDALESLALLLEAEGHQVWKAANGAEACALAAQHRPQMALLDLGMPLLNGYEAARRIRDLCGREILLVALSGWAQQADIARSRESGFDSHLVKPATFEALITLLERLPDQAPTARMAASVAP